MTGADKGLNLPKELDGPLSKRDEAMGSLSAKGLRTRRRLLDGARVAFEDRQSFVDTRISDIVRASGVSHGSFYTYFESKEQIFYEVAVEVMDEMYRENAARARGESLTERITSAIGLFLDSYRRHAAIMTIIEQAAALYPEFRGLRRHLREAFVARNITNFQHWKDEGWLDPRLNTFVAAHALVSMVDNFCYLWFVLGEDFDEEGARSTLAELWINALQISRAA